MRVSLSFVRRPHWLIALFVLISAASPLAVPRTSAAADLGKAEWIWSPKFDRLTAEAGLLYFRKTVELGEVESAKIEITCDDRYDLFVNGRPVGAGHNWHLIDVFDLSKSLTAGPNLIAVQAKNDAFGPASLVARLTVQQKDKKTVTLVTDASWKTSSEAMPGWEKPGFNESKWEAAKSYGVFGLSGPWGDQPKLAGAPAVDPKRFTPLEGFKVEEVVTPGQTGSLVNMAFNEHGDIIASRERGPLLLIRDLDHDGHFESVTPLCEEVTNCQGILPLNGHVFTVGNGPEGTALYRLSDFDSEGRAHKVKAILKYRGVGMAEHGPHAAVLGPDGLIYLIIGNHAGAAGPISDKSPHHHYYEGDLIEPKYEDANGHAVGIKSPGGTVVRTDQEGSFVELFSGGYRNAFDLALNRDGEFFTWDADMEWDVGLPWYRPTRINHVIPGSEFGWRSGWSKWPAYYLDSLPATLDIGRGSPTGLEFYDHTRFPAKYRGALFMCDWSEGRILAAFLKPAGGTYEATSEVFLTGHPLNCSDIAVGPDGWLYFCVGGRNTVGSIFRVVSTDPAAATPPKPVQPKDIMHGRVQPMIDQPQLQSAWARKTISELRDALGDRWKNSLVAVAEGVKEPSQERVRALDLMQLFSPAPTTELLVKLSGDQDVPLRRKAAYLLGLHPANEVGPRLVELLADADPAVRRVACESLARSGAAAPADKLIALLADPQPFVAWSARRALERLPKTQWQSAVLASDNRRVFLQGAVAALTLEPDRPTDEAILARAGQLLKDDKLAGNNLLDLLRVIELAIYRGQFKPEELSPLRSALSPKYPSADYRISRELVRLLVVMQDPTVAPRFVAQLSSEVPLEEKIHVAMYARFLQAGWTPELRGKLLQFYEQTRVKPGGNSFRGYLTNAASDFLKNSPPADQLQFIAQGAATPGVVLRLVQGLPDKPTSEQTAALRKLYGDLADKKSAEARELSRVVVTVLARCDDSALAWLREQFETRPTRRQEIAQALASTALKQAPRAADAPLLTRSLAVAEGPGARDILKALVKFTKPGGLKAEQLRQVILLGLRLQDQGGQDAVALLEHWTGEKQPPGDGKIVPLAAWQQWFRKTYPDSPDPSLPIEAAGNKYTYAQLLDFLNSDAAARGNSERGAAVFEKAVCIKCHRYGTRGEGIGPDLSNVSGRFQPKEILESVIYPSQVISDQFASKTVTTNSGLQYFGLVGPAGDGGVVVLQSNAEKVTIAKADIDTIVPSKKSAMPEKLFDPLTLDEIADLFAYLAKPAGK